MDTAIANNLQNFLYHLSNEDYRKADIEIQKTIRAKVQAIFDKEYQKLEKNKVRSLHENVRASDSFPSDNVNIRKQAFNKAKELAAKYKDFPEHLTELKEKHSLLAKEDMNGGDSTGYEYHSELANFLAEWELRIKHGHFQ